MIEHNTYDIYYDKEGDFLEVSFGESSEEGTTEEIEPGIFITKGTKTKEVKNIGILNFKKRTHILKEILKKVDMEFPLEIRI